MKIVSKWVASVWHRVSRDCRLYSVGESPLNAAVFDMLFLEQLSDERRDLESSICRSAALRRRLTRSWRAGPSPAGTIL